MNSNCKTPISCLHELMQRRGVVPQYDLLQESEGLGTNAPSFHYQVIADNVKAVGIARSKKDAKHAAARLALEELAKTGVPIPNYQTTSSPNVTPSRTSPVVSMQVNLVGCLQEFCTEKNIPQPEFILTADVGLPHQRSFTMDCKIATLTVSATDTTKKKAKQGAAQKMLHRLVDSLPEIIDQDLAYNDVPALPTSEEVIDCYKEQSILCKKKVNWGMRIADFPISLENNMKELNVTSEELWKEINGMRLSTFEEVLKRLDVDYTVEFSDSSEKVQAIISLNSDPDFAFFGIGADNDMALISALNDAFQFLQIMTK